MCEPETLAVGFEPYGVLALPTLIKLLADKDKKVADAATVAAEAMIEGQWKSSAPDANLAHAPWFLFF